MLFMFSTILVISPPLLFGLIIAQSNSNLGTSWDGPGAGLFSIRKRIFWLAPNGIIPCHHIIDSTEFTGISDFYAFAVNSGDPMGKVWHRFCSCFCESCMVGEFYACENEEFLEPWKERCITVTEDIQPSIQE